MSEWPKKDPVTNRMICKNCWSGIHYHEIHFRRSPNGKMENYYVQRDKLTGKAEHACDGECDCIHRSEEHYAAIEAKKLKDNLKELRKALKAQLEDPSNPLVIRA